MSSHSNLSSHFIYQISQKFTPDFLTQNPDELMAYGRDWTRVFLPRPSAIVFPRNTLEIAQFLKICSEYQVSVVPSGGRTGLSGGAVAANGEVVLSLNRMNQMEPVDTLAQTVRVQAGAVTEAVHHHCAPHGLIWPVDFASKGSSQVGGNIATNAGGVKVIRYGLTRNWVLGLQVVTMDGDILELNGALEKNNTGIDLRQVFIGSEGTLGVISEAVLKLARIPGPSDVFFFALGSIDQVLKLFHETRSAPFTTMAFEFLTHNCLKVVTENRKLSSPFSEAHPAYVLFEVERPQSPDAQTLLDQWLSSLFEQGLVLDGTLAQSPREARDLWSLREGISESLSQSGFVYKNDIALPITQLSSFIPKLYQVLENRNSEWEVYLFGHIGDGNLHVNTMKPGKMNQDEFVAQCKEADSDLFDLVKSHQGSISAEHGIGLLKKPFLSYSRSKEEIALMRKIKQVFDPQNLLNPGKIFD